MAPPRRSSSAQKTNNRMAILAAFKGLEALTRACAVEVVTDSQYLRDGATSWIKGMKGARRANGEQRFRQERRFLAAARHDRRAARDQMDLGARPQQPSDE
jgi:ribonuclease HI